MKNEDDFKAASYNDLYTNVVKWIVLFISTAVSFGVLSFLVYGIWSGRGITDVNWGILQVVVAFYLSIIVVLILKFSIGPMEFEGFGFRFRGGSGPLILWVICFSVIVGGMSVLGKE